MIRHVASRDQSSRRIQKGDGALDSLALRSTLPPISCLVDNLRNDAVKLLHGLRRVKMGGLLSLCDSRGDRLHLVW